MKATRLQLESNLDKARAELAAASSASDRGAAAAKVETAAGALAVFKAKTTHEKTTHEKETSDDEPRKPAADDDEEEEEEEEEDDDDEEEEEEESDDGDGDDDDDDDDDDDEDEEEEEEEEEKSAKAAVSSAKAALKAAKGTKNADAIGRAKESVSYAKAFAASAAKSRSKARAPRATARSATGKKGSAKLIASLQTMPEAMRKQAGQIASITRSRKADRVKSVLAAATADGRLTPALRAELATTEGRKRKLGTSSTKALRSFVSALPKTTRLTGDGASQGTTRSGAKDGDAPPALGSVIVDASNPEHMKALRAGMPPSFTGPDGRPVTKSIDEFMAAFAQTTAALAARDRS